MTPKTAGVDSGSDHSVFPHPPSPHPTDPLIINQPKADAPSVCHAHLVFLDRYGGVALSPNPCQGKRIKTGFRLNVDWFFQHGVRVEAHDGPVAVQMCSKNRGYYDGRLAGRKCQHSDCREAGILMGFRGVEISERPVHLQTRLAMSPSQVADD